MKKIMKKIEKELTQVIADYSGFVPFSIEVVHYFRISEDDVNFDKVFLVRVLDRFYVIWRWTTMNSYALKCFISCVDAYSFYSDRQAFAVHCNSSIPY